MNESLFPVEEVSKNINVSEQSSEKNTGICLSGWIATLLGLYLVESGIFNIVKIAQGGESATEQGTEMLRQSGIDANAAGSAPLSGVTQAVLWPFPEGEQEQSEDDCLDADCSAPLIHYEP